MQQEIRRTKDQPGAWCGELLGEALFAPTPDAYLAQAGETAVQRAEQAAAA